MACGTERLRRCGEPPEDMTLHLPVGVTGKGGQKSRIGTHFACQLPVVVTWEQARVRRRVVVDGRLKDPCFQDGGWLRGTDQGRTAD